MKMPLFLVTLFMLVFPTEAANILILHPVYSGSHEFVLRKFGDHLVQRGHNVTQVRFKHTNTHFNLNTNVTVITLDIKDRLGTCGRYINDRGELDIGRVGAKLLWQKGHSVTGLPFDMFCLADVHCDTLLSDHDLYKQFNATNFDVAIVDLISNECSLALVRSLNLPTMAFWGFSLHAGEVMYTSNFCPPSLVPGFFSGLSCSMTFQERVYNFLVHTFHKVFMLIQEHWSEHYIRKRFPDLPPVGQMIHEIDMTLVNTNMFMDCPRLLAPNTRYVGGLNIKEIEPLPTDLNAFVSDAKHGVVLFSLGYTGFSPKDIPQSIINSLLGAFAQLNQRVIMRFDPELLTLVPDNVLVKSWVPQQDILGHPKTIAFVSHCGTGGVLEAIYHGVPIVGIPIFSDQLENAAKIQAKGLGLALQKNNIDQQVVFEAINKVIHDKSYFLEVDKLSKIWRDQMSNPMDEATHWLELLVKYHNFDYLRIDDFQYNFFQYFSIDVVTFLLLLTSLFIYVQVLMCRFIFTLRLRNVGKVKTN